MSNLIPVGYISSAALGVLPLHIKTGPDAPGEYFYIPHFVALGQAGTATLFDIRSFYGNFDITYQIEYDGVKCTIPELMQKSALLEVAELAPWDNAPEVGSRFWVNFDDEHFKFTG